MTPEANAILLATRHKLVGLLPVLGEIKRKIGLGETLPEMCSKPEFWKDLCDKIKTSSEQLDLARGKG